MSGFKENISKKKILLKIAQQDFLILNE